MSDEQQPHPLHSIVEELIHAVPDRGLRDWRGWLRDEREFGDDLRQRFNDAGFNERQIEFLWKLIVNVADYQMHLLMDFIEFNASVGRIKIQIYSKPQPSEADPDVFDPQVLENEIDTGDEFPGWYIGWSEKFAEVSDDWQVEKSRDPAAPRVRPKPSPQAQALKCAFCGSSEYAEDEVWQSPLSECRICTNCATMATMLLRKDESEDGEANQVET